jgi:hypothetical protein
MPITAFDPTVHGFHFDNDFVNEIATLPGGSTLRTNGRCGGMTYGALDYFHLGRPAPAYTPRAPAKVPPDSHPLARYLLSRQLESFKNDSAARFLAWTIFPDEGLPFAKGVRKWTASEIPQLRAEIDAGRPVALGLVGARTLRDVGRRNHQAVAFGYQAVTGGVDVLIYDPNDHDTTSILHWRRDQSPIAASNRPRRPWRGLFVHDYTPRVPPRSAG